MLKYIFKIFYNSLDGPTIVHINLFVRSIMTISDNKMVSHLVSRLDAGILSENKRNFFVVLYVYF